MAPNHDLARPLISLCYDGGHISHWESVIPALAKVGLQATFYVEPTVLLDQVSVWRHAAEAGHEVGDGSLMGACLHDGSLPMWTLAMVLDEVSSARDLIEDLIPGHVSTVGLPWGDAVCSDCDDYAPTLVREFGLVRTGSTGFNRREGFDGLIKVIPMAGLSLAQMGDVVNQLKEDGGWGVLSFDGVGSGNRAVDARAHAGFLENLAVDDEIEIEPVIEAAKSMTGRASFRVL